MGDVRADLPFIKSYMDRHGRRRYYFRRRGFPAKALPGAPGSAEFIAAYHSCVSAKPLPAPSVTPLTPGSFKALCHDYDRSAEFHQLAKSTQREMGYVIASLLKLHADKPVVLMERKHVLKWRDEMKDRPGAANKMLRTLKTLMRFAVDRGYRDDNPVNKIKLMKLGEFRPWTADEMRAFEARWPLGSLERTGYALALYTGQRRSDVARLTWKSIAGNAFVLKQGKTGTDVEIPIHPALKEALAAVHPRHEAAILTGDRGRLLNPVYFGHKMAKAIQLAGLPDDCVLHGLRKSAAVALIDAGCTPHQAMAITGHKTPHVFEHYAKKRDQAKLGKAAMLKWKRAK